MKEEMDYRDAAWVAELLRVDEGTVQELMESGELPGFRLGPKWLVAEGKLRQFLKEEDERQAVARRRTRPGRAAVRRGRRSASRSHPRRQEITYLLFGKPMVAQTSKQLLLGVLRELSQRDAKFLPRFSQERARKRQYVAQNPLDLYPGRPDLARDAKEELQPGWWAGTNYSASEIEAILSKACRTAGLKWGKDLIISRPSATERRRKALRFVGTAADAASDVARRHSEYFAETLTHAGR